MISREELDRIRKMAKEYTKPTHPRTGEQTIALYDRLQGSIMQNLQGILDAAYVGVYLAPTTRHE